MRKTHEKPKVLLARGTGEGVRGRSGAWERGGRALAQTHPKLLAEAMLG